MRHFHVQVVMVLGALLFAAGHADAQLNETLKITAFDAVAFDEFGFSVALSGTTAVVGARFDGDAGGESGSAYVFDTTTGNELFKLIASDAAFDDRFGVSVALSGATALVGARFGDAAGPFSNTGSAYVFNNVPEPATGLLLAVAALAALRRRHR